MARPIGFEPMTHALEGRCSDPAELRAQKKLERAAGIEPASSAWKAEVIAFIRCPRKHLKTFERQHWCGWRDSNSHAVKHHPLKMACLPISPQPHCVGTSVVSQFYFSLSTILLLNISICLFFLSFTVPQAAVYAVL